MKVPNPFKGFIEDIKNWLNAQLDLIRVKGIKKGVEISSQVSFSMLILLLGLLGFFFLSIALALFIGKLVHSFSLGFLIIGAVPILLIMMMFIFKKKIYRTLLHFFTRIFTK